MNAWTALAQSFLKILEMIQAFLTVLNDAEIRSAIVTATKAKTNEDVDEANKKFQSAMSRRV
jgi:hypothetical protein